MRLTLQLPHDEASVTSTKGLWVGVCSELLLLNEDASEMRLGDRVCH